MNFVNLVWGVLMSKKSEIVKQAKAHGLFVTDNHGAIDAAKNLYTANQRIIELEAMLETPVNSELWRKLNHNYNEKWRGK